MTNKELSNIDLKYFWHPCSQMKDHKNLDIIPIKYAKGVKLFDYDGNSYIDCISSWWVNLFGHSNEYINKQLAKQASELEHTIMAGFSHKAIIDLSRRLCEISGFEKVFYADNGSSSIEVALKMSFHKNLLRNKNKDHFLTLNNSYHGETIGALSVGNVELYKKIYSPLLIKSITAKVPMNFKKNEVSEDEALSDLEQILKNNHHKISAFILEPLVQCAGCMNMISANFIKSACEMVKKYDIDVIFDEIAVGFGRTGEMFAFNSIGFKPDFLCLSKGITGGYLPLSVVLTSDEVYNEFYADYNEFKAFLHSHSYAGNALACACANASLDIFEKDDIINKNKILAKFIYNEFKKLTKFDFVDNFRQTGMILAFDLIGFDGIRKGYEVYLKGLKQGLLLRPLGNTIYFMPPYVISEDEIKFVVEKIDAILKEG